MSSINNNIFIAIAESNNEMLKRLVNILERAKMPEPKKWQRDQEITDQIDENTNIVFLDLDILKAVEIVKGIAEKNPTAHIVIISKKLPLLEVEGVKEAGATTFLLKPILPSLVLAAIHKYAFTFAKAYEFEAFTSH